MNLPLDLLTTGYLVCWILSTRYALMRGGRNRRVWGFAAGMLTVGLCSLAAAWCIGSHLDSEGFLVEPFFLIGGGALLSLAGSLITGVMLVVGGIRRGVAAYGGAK